jgi:serine/threonine protein kinase
MLKLDETFKNKDLLIVSLLEFILKIVNNSDNNELLAILCRYLHQNGVLSDQSYYTDSQSREVYQNILVSFISKYNSMKNNNLENNSFPLEIYKENFNTKIIHNQLSRFRNDFINLGILGKGGYGCVYKVLNRIDDTQYAIKKIIFSNDNDLNDLSFNEVKIISKLCHPNVVRYHTSWMELDDVSSVSSVSPNISSSNIDSVSSNNSIEISYSNASRSNEFLNLDSSNEENKYQLIKKDEKLYPVLYIQMELCKMNLKEYLEKRNYHMKKINDIENFKQICLGLMYIHRKGIVHRDLCTMNILIDTDGTLKIGDFGLSNIDSFDENFSGGHFLYRPPEKRSSQKGDIYSLGIIYYELITHFSCESERIDRIQKLRLKHDFFLNILSPDPFERPSLDMIMASI